MKPHLVDKLRAMAHADESPHEAAIAAAKLAAAGVPIDPPRPPAPPAAGDPGWWTAGGPGWWVNWTVSTTGTVTVNGPLYRVSST